MSLNILCAISEFYRITSEFNFVIASECKLIRVSLNAQKVQSPSDDCSFPVTPSRFNYVHQYRPFRVNVHFYC